MTKRILVEFKSMLNKTDWMDDESKERAKEKANYVKLQVGYPEYYENLTFIQENYNVSFCFFSKFDFIIKLINFCC